MSKNFLLCKTKSLICIFLIEPADYTCQINIYSNGNICLRQRKEFSNNSEGSFSIKRKVKLCEKLMGNETLVLDKTENLNIRGEISKLEIIDDNLQTAVLIWLIHL